MGCAQANLALQPPGSVTDCGGAPDGTSCDDGSACTSGDACLGGGCSGAPVSCDDSQACTIESCSPSGGCTSQPAPGCGGCSAAGQCNNANVCTTDTCDGGTCGHALVSGCMPCASNAACPLGKQCDSQKCVPKPAACVDAASCTDGNDCTTDACQPALGCTHTPISGCSAPLLCEDMLNCEKQCPTHFTCSCSSGGSAAEVAEYDALVGCLQSTCPAGPTQGQCFGSAFSGPCKPARNACTNTPPGGCVSNAPAEAHDTPCRAPSPLFP